MQPSPTHGPPKCVACGSSEVTAPTHWSPDEGSTRVSWTERATGNMFSAVAHRASVCLSCGHVAIRLDDRQLDKVRRAIAGLVPM